MAPLDIELLKAIKGFLDEHGIRGYSEHLSACAGDGQLYDLMPLPFTGETMRRVAATYLVMLLTLFFSGAGRWLSVDYGLARTLRRQAG